MSEVAPREGSSLYYSLLYLPPEKRDRLLRRLALLKAVSETLHDVSDSQVAQQKIHWWHEEIDRLLQGEARHPATQALGDELYELDAARGALLALLGVTADQRLSPSLANEAERLARLQRQADAGIRLTLHAIGNDAAWLEAEHAVPASLARAHGEMNQLLQLPRLLHRGYEVFSDELYQRFGLSAAQLARRVAVASPDSGSAPFSNDHDPVGSSAIVPEANREPGRESDADADPDAGPLYAVATKSALVAFEQTDSDWAPPKGTAGQATLPLRTLSALRARQCRLWLEREPDLLRERTSLAPLHKLYIAWRWKRRVG